MNRKLLLEKSFGIKKAFTLTVFDLSADRNHTHKNNPKKKPKQQNNLLVRIPSEILSHTRASDLTHRLTSLVGA